jgi:hypothetical protein
MNKIEENIQASGALVIELRGPDGKLKERHELKNLVVGAGLTFLASRAVGTAKAIMSHMAIGSNNAAAANGNTTLGGELGRAVLTSATAAGAVVTYTSSFGPGVGTGAVTEAGIFNDGAAGDMLCRTVFGVVTKEANDTLGFTWQVTLAAA